MMVQNPKQNAIEGKCLFMCPLKETNLREREGLLHKFEYLDVVSIPGESLPTHASSLTSIHHRRPQNPSSNSSSRGNRNSRRNLPKADRMKTVKCFSRSAAGLDKTCPDDLRPPQILQRTVYYLCTEVLTRTDEPIKVVYDFVFDRLRSVRQDLVIQRISDVTAIRVLEAVVNFHVYSAYRCRNESKQNFDHYINNRHLIDCLKTLIRLYEFNDYWEPPRDEFEALYVIICPDSSEVLSRAIAIRHLVKGKVFQSAIEMSLAYQSRNYVQYFRKLNSLPLLLGSYVVQHASHMRSIAFQILSIAYGNQNCKIPLQSLTLLLRYNSIDDLEHNFRQISTEIVKDDSGNKFARFSKTTPIDEFSVDKISRELKIPNCDVIDPKNIQFIANELICPWKGVIL